jgi:hypothetical protein
LQLTVLVLDFVEQPHVLDRYHRLIGEVCDQLDLLVAEWPYLLAVDDNCADELIFFEHRHSEK